MIVNFAQTIPVVTTIFLMIFGYLFGSIPSGYLAGKWLKELI